MPRSATTTALQSRRLVVYLGTAMIAASQPVHEVEEEVTRVARFLGYPDAQIGALPTGLTLSLESGDPASYERAGAPLTLDQITELNRIRRSILNGSMPLPMALTALTTLRSHSPRYGRLGTILGGTINATGVAGIMQPGVANILFVAAAGLVVMLLIDFSRNRPTMAALLPTIAAFVVGTGAFTLSSLNLLTGPMRTILPGVVVLLPGGMLVTGMAELAASQAVAGASRLVNGIMQLMLLAFGISVSAWLLQVPIADFANFRVTPYSSLFPIIGLAFMCIGIMVMDSVQWRLWPWVAGVLVATFLAQLIGQQISGSGNVGGFLGAFVASFLSLMAAKLQPSLPRMVAFQPSFWLIVPGTLGLFSTTQLGAEPSLVLTTVISIIAVMASLSMGLLFGSASFRALDNVLDAQRRRSEKARRRRQLTRERKKQAAPHGRSVPK